MYQINSFIFIWNYYFQSKYQNRSSLAPLKPQPASFRNWDPKLVYVLPKFTPSSSPIFGPFGLKMLKYLHAEHETNTEFSDSSFGMTNELHWPTQYLFLIVRGRQPWCLIDIFSFLASHQSFGISFSERPKYSHLALKYYTKLIISPLYWYALIMKPQNIYLW